MSMLCRHVCFVSNNVVADECDHVVLDKAALCMVDTLCIQHKCAESALCVQQIDVVETLRDPIKFRSRYMMFITVILTILSTMCEDDLIVSPAEYL